MTTKERYEGVLGWFAGKMPVAESELKYNDPFELIVAVILSAANAHCIFFKNTIVWCCLSGIQKFDSGSF